MTLKRTENQTTGEVRCYRDGRRIARDAYDLTFIMARACSCLLTVGRRNRRGALVWHHSCEVPQ